MFTFNVPRFAMLQVVLPTGGTAGFVHIGGGRFLSATPPIALTGISPDGPMQVEGIDIGWDRVTLPGDSEAAPAMFAYDPQAAYAAVSAAAKAGDTFAQKVMERFAAAERDIESAQAAMAVVPVDAVAGAVADADEPAANGAAEAVETVKYADGAEATGVAPLPAESPSVG